MTETTTAPAEPLAIIPKGKTRCIIVRLATFKGVTRLDIREHYRDDNGEWAPTKQHRESCSDPLFSFTSTRRC